MFNRQFVRIQKLIVRLYKLVRDIHLFFTFKCLLFRVDQVLWYDNCVKGFPIKFEKIINVSFVIVPVNYQKRYSLQ